MTTFLQHFLTLDEYHDFVGNTAIFKGDIGILYCAMKLNGEVGEVNGKLLGHMERGFTDVFFKKYIDGESKMELVRELGDVLWYVAALARECGSTIKTVWQRDDKRVYLRPNSGLDVVMSGQNMSFLAGQIAEKIGKRIRDQNACVTNDHFKGDEAFVNYIEDTLSGIMTSVFMIGDTLGMGLSDIIAENVSKLESRKKRGVLSGSGDNR